jgi:hypothetical protein
MMLITAFMYRELKSVVFGIFFANMILETFRYGLLTQV